MKEKDRLKRKFKHYKNEGSINRKGLSEHMGKRKYKAKKNKKNKRK